MGGISALLADRFASLLPRTTAGACVPNSPWSSRKGSCSPAGYYCCSSYRECHLSCNGRAICGGWIFAGCCCGPG
jgi:hypothetical protein